MPTQVSNITSSHAISSSSSSSSSLSPPAAAASAHLAETTTYDEVTEAVMQEAAALNLNRKMLTM